MSEIDRFPPLKSGGSAKVKSSGSAYVKFCTLASFGFGPPSWPQGYVASIGTLAPFLSINSWTSIIEARRNCEITDIGFRVFEANLVNQIEQAVYVYRRGVALNADYERLLKQLQQAEKKLKQLQATSGISRQDGELLANALVTTIGLVVDESSLNSMPNDLFTILQMLGVRDLELVQNIKIGFEVMPIEDMVPLDHEVVAQAAAKMSIQYLERLQAQKTTDLLRVQKIERPFKLLDLAGDTTNGFGMSLYGELRLDEIHIAISRKIERMISDQLFNTVLNAVENYNDSVLGYKNSLEEQERLQKSLNSLLEPLTRMSDSTDKGLSVAEISAIKGSVTPVVSLCLRFINAIRGYHALFRISRASIDRALLQNHYSIFQKKEKSSALTQGARDSFTVSGITVPDDDRFNDETVLDPMKCSGCSYRIDVPGELPIQVVGSVKSGKLQEKQQQRNQFIFD